MARACIAGRSVALLALGLACATLAGCDARQVGNGVYAERSVRVGDFAGVRIEDGIDALITVGPGLAQSVTLSGDENIVTGSLRTSLEVETVGSTAVTVLHVWASPSFTAVIPARVTIVRSSLTRVRGGDGAVIELSRPSGATGVGAALAVELEGATLSARAYPIAGATVELDEGATALLHSDGAVTGVVSGNSHLDNTAGEGPCLVTTTSGGAVSCN